MQVTQLNRCLVGMFVDTIRTLDFWPFALYLDTGACSKLRFQEDVKREQALGEEQIQH